MSTNYHTETQANLTALNTMRLECIADNLISLNDESQIAPVVKKIRALNEPLFVLSGGSNVILPSHLHAHVIKPDLKGVNILNEDAESITIEVMAGEPWHDLVVTTVTNGWYGLENLALIPGLTGAAPVQNIGAYGVQLEDNLTHVRAYHLPTDAWRTLSKDECEFDYRNSKFKREAGEWLIARVGFALHKDAHKTNADYGDVAKLATKLATGNQRSKASPIDVMHAIIQIRQSKLPNPDTLSNCGSFFKNPIIPTKQFSQLQKDYADIVGYKVDASHTKVAAGWLIDKAGLKGRGIFPILTHVNQALVLVNHTDVDNQTPATQADIQATQDFIQQKIKADFGIELEREPVWVDSVLLNSLA